MPFFDGVRGRVHYRCWAVQNPAAVLVFLHGRGQHTGHYHRFGRAMNDAGIEVWGIDHIGHGLSEGDPEVAPEMADLATNALHLVAVAADARPGVPLSLMGHSLGAGTALIAMQGGAPEISHVRCVVLCGTPKRVDELDIKAPLVPTLLVHGTDDRLAPIDPVRSWLERRPGIDVRVYADAGHDLLHEPVRDTVTAEVAEFVLQQAV